MINQNIYMSQIKELLKLYPCTYKKKIVNEFKLSNAY